MFSEDIEQKRKTNPWWKRNTTIIETGQKIKLSEFTRLLSELNYTKTWEATHKGEFSQKGEAIHVFPINTDKLYSIEFAGNYIAEITTSASLGSSTPSVSKPTLGVSPPSAFHIEDYVVHIDHGIGVYRGLTQNNADIIIEYAAPRNTPTKPDLLFVPKNQQSRLQPYLGLNKPELHRLGTPIWNITKKKAKEDIIEFAKELLSIFAQRNLVTRRQHAPERELEDKLISSFSHEYTASQKKALSEIYRDLASPTPMDRVLVGDVGFGKTEIAVATAFRIVLNNQQVAIIAPTTVLADQHYETFKKRLSPFGVSVGRITRLESMKELKEMSEKCVSGNVDIIVGTHKLFGKNINFNKLGLLVIDEEQKFGVSQKEHFKKHFPSLDILSLSATPIPRTLNIAFSGIKQISTLNEPPEGRKKTKTYILPKNKKIIKEAITTELARGGQIYFLANRIHKIPFLIEELKSLKTSASIGILHGRMKEKNIIQTMHDFRAKKTNLLVSTTIIENGLDISGVDTLIVEDSTRLGLSQAHQLRGRVGRPAHIQQDNKNKEARAYFFYPAKRLGEKAAERLEALEKYSWLGAGIEIAKRDLEIRGAGNILGKQQSGVAYKIGLNLYFQLLEEAVEHLKQNPS